MKKLIVCMTCLIVLFSFDSFSKGWTEENGAWRYYINDTEYAIDEIRRAGDDSYYLGEDGLMAKDYLLQTDDDVYYFGEDGKMQKNVWVAVSGEDIDESDLDYDAYYFYFGNNGKAIKGDEGKRWTIDGKKYFFNEKGIMLTGWISKSGEHLDSVNSDDWYSADAEYYASADGVLHEGWLAWGDGLKDTEENNIAGDRLDFSVMYFYFNPSNNKKVEGRERTINGKKYSFLKDNGRMMTEWEYLESNYTSADSNITTAEWKNKYYSKEDDGHLAKRQWIYAIPSAVMGTKEYDDEEEKWFYADGGGQLVLNKQKTINKKRYVFDKKGIMQTGLVIMNGNEYKTTIDLEETSYVDFVKTYTYVPRNRANNVSPEDAKVDDFYLMDQYSNGRTIKYFGDEGDEKRGSKAIVHFSDGDYEFTSAGNGGLIEWKKKKYYINGFVAKPTGEAKYAVLLDGFVVTNNGTGGITEDMQFDPRLSMYGNYLEQVVDGGYGAGTLQNMMKAKDYPAWKAYYPVGMMYYEPFNADPTKGVLNGLGLGGNPTHIGYMGFCVGANGKLIKKGVYRDGENYWLVDSNKQMVGHFNVPVKWGKKEQTNPSTGETKTYDWPYYKSDYRTYNASGEEIVKLNHWIPFTEKDINGKTELDFVEPYTDDECANFVYGTNTNGMPLP